MDSSVKTRIDFIYSPGDARTILLARWSLGKPQSSQEPMAYLRSTDSIFVRRNCAEGKKCKDGAEVSTAQ